MPLPLIHLADLFRPREDPDNHWDLATSFALAHARSPDTTALAQINHITGLQVPCAVGFLHAAGLTVSRDGDLVTMPRTHIKPAYAFQPIEADCTESVIVRWRPT